MADETISTVNVNMGDDEPGGGKSSAQLIATIQTSVVAISRNVAQLLGVVRMIRENVSRIASLQSAIASQLHSGRASASAGARAASSINNWAGLGTAARAARIGGSAATSRFYLGAIGQAGGIPAFASLSSVAAAASFPRGQQQQQRRIRGIPGVPFGGKIAPFLGFGGTLLGSQALMWGGVGVGLAFAGYGMTRLVANSGASSLRELSRFSPQIAQYQAEVDVGKALAAIRRGGNPLVQKAAGFYSRMALQNVNDPMWTMIESVKLFAAGAAEWLTSPSMMLNLISPGLGSVAKMFGRTPPQGGGSPNRIMWDALDDMVGGLLDMQQTLPPRHGKFKFIPRRRLTSRVGWDGDGWRRELGHAPR